MIRKVFKAGFPQKEQYFLTTFESRPVKLSQKTFLCFIRFFSSLSLEETIAACHRLVLGMRGVELIQSGTVGKAIREKNWKYLKAIKK